MDYMPINQFAMSPASMQPPPKPRKKAPTLRDADWEPHQALITELYASGKTLKDVIAIVKAQTGFQAEVRQYKSRISKWNLDKNVKTKEMKSIVRKRQKRAVIEIDRPELLFQVRGNVIDPTKIDRWMREHDIPENELYSPSSVASTPSAVDWQTNTEPSTPVMRSFTSTPVTEINRELPRLHHWVPQGVVSNKGVYHDIWNVWYRFMRKMDTTPSSDYEFELRRCQELSDVYVQRSDMREYGPGESHRGPSLFFIPFYLMHESSPYLGQMFAYFLSMGCNIESRDMDGNTPLLRACLYDIWISYEHLFHLIQHGANVNAKTFSGFGALDLVFPPLEYPPRLGPYRVVVIKEKVRLLLQAGCDPKLHNYPSEDEVGKRIWKEALENEKKRRSLLPPQETQHLPSLP